MKKILFSLLSALMILALSSCGKEDAVQDVTYHFGFTENSSSPTLYYNEYMKITTAYENGLRGVSGLKSINLFEGKMIVNGIPSKTNEEVKAAAQVVEGALRNVSFLGYYEVKIISETSTTVDNNFYMATYGQK